MCYAAGGSNCTAIVFDMSEEKQNGGILAGKSAISSDSRRVAFGADAQGKQPVVVDGQEGKHHYGSGESSVSSSLIVNVWPMLPLGETNGM